MAEGYAVSAARGSAAPASLVAALMFVLSLWMSANSNGLAQLFFLRHEPQRKVFWLAVTLVAATSSSILGVMLARRRASAAWATVLAIGVAGAIETWLPVARSSIEFVALVSASQFALNWALNATDLAAVSSTEDRAAFDRSTTVARLLGMLVAPAVVTLLASRTGVLRALFAVLALVALALGARLARSSSGDRRATTASGATNASDRVVLGFAWSVYVSLYLLAANLLYFLRDLAGVRSAERVGGVTLSVVFAGALVAAGVRSRLPAWVSGERASMLAPVFMLSATAATLAARVALSLPVLLVGGALLGASYGLLLSALREYVTRGAVEEGRGGLLSAFNNLANASGLTAFALMSLLASALRGACLYEGILGVAGLLPLFGAAALLRYRRRSGT
ncbi:MAG: hypothetical protein JNK05_15775 [Myxococcales bacterium]|nr:hypothetical protein [Myxococcales bacterium]